MPSQRPATNEVEISLFGPGYGECIVIHVGENEWVIVDSCIDAETRSSCAIWSQLRIWNDANGNEQVDADADPPELLTMVLTNNSGVFRAQSLGVSFGLKGLSAVADIRISRPSARPPRSAIVIFIVTMILSGCGNFGTIYYGGSHLSENELTCVWASQTYHQNRVSATCLKQMIGLPGFVNSSFVRTLTEKGFVCSGDPADNLNCSFDALRQTGPMGPLFDHSFYLEHVKVTACAWRDCALATG